MSARRHAWRKPMALVSAAALVALGSGPAAALDTDGLESLSGSVTEKLRPTTAPTSTSTSTESPSSGGSAGSGGLEDALRDVTGSTGSGDTGSTAQGGGSTSSGDHDDPASSAGAGDSAAHAEAQVAELSVQDQQVLDLGRSEASIHESGDSSGHATLLALGGEEVLGAHAESGGEEEGHAGDPLAPLCEGSEGQLCLGVLFADAYADEDADGARSHSRTGVLDACLGGDDVDRREGCSGPVGAKVAASEATTERDDDGTTRGSTESALADVCVQPEDDGCAVGLEVLKSQSSASSDGRTAGSSTLARLVLANEEVLSISDNAAVELQPECAEPSALCMYLNEGTSTVADGVASQTQQAVSAGLLPDTLNGVLGISTTGVSAAEAGAGGGNDGSGGSGGAGGSGTAGGAGGPGAPGAGGLGGPGTGLLPNTGGVWSGLLAAGLAAVGAGCLLLARRRALVLAD